MTEIVLSAMPPTPEAIESAWRRVQLARHPQRPRTLDLVALIFDDFSELHGDRSFRDDPAIVGGPALLNGRAVMVIGHQKGGTPSPTSRATSARRTPRDSARHSA